MATTKKVNNLALWNKVEKTNPDHTKKVSHGRKFTSINATHQIHNATEQWGMYGHTWGLKDIKVDYLNLINDQVMAIVDSVFYYPDGEFEIGTSIYVQQWLNNKGYHKVDDDWRKKAETDIVTKALSKLGFNADVFFGMYDDNRYIAAMEMEFAPKPIIDAVSIQSFNQALPSITIDLKQSYIDWLSANFEQDATVKGFLDQLNAIV